jgi:hypothetical protein
VREREIKRCRGMRQAGLRAPSMVLEGGKKMKESEVPLSSASSDAQNGSAVCANRPGRRRLG